MTGSSVSSPPTAASRKDELAAELDRVGANLGLPSYRGEIATEATALLEVSRAQMRAMTAVEASEAALLLAQFAFYLQRSSNRSVALRDWCETNIRSVIAATVGEVKGYSLEERRPLAVLASTAATKLSSMKARFAALATDIEYLSLRVENCARQFSLLAQTKASQHG